MQFASRYESNWMNVVWFLPLSFAMCVGLLGASRTSRVEIDSGVLEGRVYGSLDGGAPGGVAFLGIPFAAPPVGNARWEAPRGVAAWLGVRSASHETPACPQLPSSWWPEMAARDRFVTDEDCLYLNVWTDNLRSGRAQPVMVWIHGGGNVEGSSLIPPLAPALVRKGVVVVSVDYRLGVLGFLSLSDQMTGNYGLLDQIAALKWIHRNIQNFGGDPAKVTIFGESSGAEDVCHLMSSPLAAGLFQRTILESGVCMDSVYPGRNEAKRRALHLAQAFGIPADQNALAKLRALKADELVKKASKLHDGDFSVIVDGRIVPAQPAITFGRGKQTRVPVLVGSNANEVTVFGKASPMGTTDSRPKTVKAYRTWLTNEFQDFADEVWRVHPAKADSDVPTVFLRMQTDCAFGFGAHRLAQFMTKLGSPTYLYYFTKVGRGPFARLGAFHSEELMFVGDTYWKSWMPNDADRKLADKVGNYWTNFAKTGDPNGHGLPFWPQFAAGSEEVIQVNDFLKIVAIPNQSGYAVFEKILQPRLALSRVPLH